MPPPKQLPWKDAIVEVLKSENKAMHYTEIATEILKRSLRLKVGATPPATVNVTIHDSIKKDGANSPFIKVGTGEFILKSSAQKAPSGAGEPATDEAEETGGIIRAFGMFWRRDWVNWRANPAIFGKQQEGADAVNFAEQHGVYFLLDGREVIYVGRATEKRLGARLLEHTRDRLNGRWDRFSWFGLCPVAQNGKLGPVAIGAPTEEELIVTFEALLIEGLEPRQNRKRGDAFRAVEYIQAEDPSVATKAKNELIADLIGKLK